MLPRDKGGVVDPRLKVTHYVHADPPPYTHSPWSAGLRDAELARSRPFYPSAPHWCADSEYVHPSPLPRGFYSCVRVDVCALVAYVYGLAEQGMTDVLFPFH